MSVTEQQQERRIRDRSQGIVLRRRQRLAVQAEADRRRNNDASRFDLAAALELHLDEVKTRRAMIALLEGWLDEAKSGDTAEQDADYVRAVEKGIAIMKSAPDVLTGIAVLQRE